ncbi:16S rRNA (guanine(527)-N(7))-methyltransferase RsmG [Marinimicrobium sp. ABcell2]|uniref:16S rRNA (guanine(527)-N(7))-methyltransferase RsmG n=1 Tax=Marinimicrobium sp. ABcell2 TaxID=3069751 RepID=UPI0027B0ED23|nr:16S rRNA (guanine(527)-N(7))-methyltransferase RsmG [Marinimicrobium sp. ABcell2]MDQ2077032.1 16S rRNA (guanine(527)-N(7))-methyltransferase RsmG [Marinimicrobium sp. ABcell2]
MSDPVEALRPALEAGAAEMGLALTELQLDQLLIYLAELDKWNHAYNLSAVRDVRAMVSRHLLDSLSVLQTLRELNPASAIDVGTGGGLPGIPLAIMLPECQFTLLDSAGKKTRFLFHVVTKLGLENVRVENRRVESFQPKTLYPVVLSRAFASLADMTSNCFHLLAPKGVFLAMKGQYPAQELAEIEATYRIVSTHKLNVPETEGERHLVVLQPLERA